MLLIDILITLNNFNFFYLLLKLLILLQKGHRHKNVHKADVQHVSNSREIQEDRQLLKTLLMLYLEVIEADEDASDSEFISLSISSIDSDKSSSVASTTRSKFHTKQNMDGSKRRKRRHRKRSTFDSISHHGSFGGFGSSYHTQKKLKFSFKNLFPFLLKDLKER